MSNGDRSYKHMVVCTDDIGDLKNLCFTDKGEPAVYEDSGPAELYAAQRREKYPGYKFKVIAFQVL